MSYTGTQLRRVAQRHGRSRLWRARLARLWKTYLRIAVALASVLGKVMLLVQYFVVLPLFALLAKRAARREQPGWSQCARARGSARSQFS
jgi:hypothetical protein